MWSPRDSGGNIKMPEAIWAQYVPGNSNTSTDVPQATRVGLRGVQLGLQGRVVSMEALCSAKRILGFKASDED
jgi:hypothetical protein